MEIHTVGGWNYNHKILTHYMAMFNCDMLYEKYTFLTIDFGKDCLAQTHNTFNSIKCCECNIFAVM